MSRLPRVPSPRSVPALISGDLAQIRGALAADFGQVVENLVGEPANRAMSNKVELRFGTKGALSVVIAGRKRGSWFDHSAGCGGSPLDLIKHLRPCNFEDALAWARKWTGIGLSGHVDQPERAPRPQPCPQRALDAIAAAEEEAAAKAGIALRLWNEARPVSGTLGETYLIETRKIPAPPGGWPFAVRYHARTQSLIVAATLEDGTVQAVQRIELTPDGLNRRCLETGRKLKISNGPQSGAVVRLGAMDDTCDGPLLLAEGPETGLSVWRATGHEVWITLGSMSRMEPPVGRQIVVCADDDPPAADIKNGRATKALRAAVRRWRGDGASVIVATPYEVPKGLKGDFNDVLREGGLEAVAARITAAFPTLDIPARQTLFDARATLDGVTGAFFDDAAVWHAAVAEYAIMTASWDEETGNPLCRPMPASAPPVHMIRCDVGVGKSASARSYTSVFLKDREPGDTRPVFFSVPTHKLGEEQVRAFQPLGVTARVWRGRAAPDPAQPGKAMCHDLEAIEMARDAGADASKAVCGGGCDGAGNLKPECAQFAKCGYQRQKWGDTPDVWVIPHELLFLKPAKEMGQPLAVVIDESFWAAGLRESNPFPLDLLEMPTDTQADSEGRLYSLRRRMLGVLRALPDGPVARAALVDALFETANSSEAHSLEWRRLVPVNMFPGMAKSDRREAAEAASVNRDVIRMAGFWHVVRALVEPDGPERSGWLSLGRSKDGAREIHVQGRADVKTAWQVPTLILDATLAPALVLPFYPQAELVADVSVVTPYQRVIQVADCAFSKGMYYPISESVPSQITARNNLTKLRTILIGTARHYWPGQVLVVLQKSVEAGLLALGPMPSNLETAHHNAVKGVDKWKDIRALVTVGRTLPGPAAVEQMAAQLTGCAVDAVAEWYPEVATAREMASGPIGAANAVRHPNPIAESIRWQIAEGELVQIIGRGRGVGRTDATLLDVLVLSDLPLPVPVDELIIAKDLEPSPVDEMLALGGVAFLSARDAAEAYPGLFVSAKAAKHQLERRGLEVGPKCLLIDTNRRMGLTSRARYQRAGPGQRLVEMLFDPNVVSDPREWLERTLGAVVFYEDVEPLSEPVGLVSATVLAAVLLLPPALCAGLVDSVSADPASAMKDVFMIERKAGLDPAVIYNNRIAAPWAGPFDMLRVGDCWMHSAMNPEVGWFLRLANRRVSPSEVYRASPRVPFVASNESRRPLREPFARAG